MPNWKHLIFLTATVFLFPVNDYAHANEATAIIESLAPKAEEQQAEKVPNGYYNPHGKSPKQKVLGIARETWEKDLTELLKRPLEASFLDNVLENEKTLKQKRSSDFFRPLDSETDTFRNRRNNPMFVYGKKKKYRYITSMELSKPDYARVIDFIPELQESLSDSDIEKYLPYIALCAVEGMNFSDIRFYVRRDIALGSPISIATERLYRELKFENGEI